MSRNKRPEYEYKDDNVFMYKWYIKFYNTADEDAGEINPVYLDTFSITKSFKVTNIPQIFAKMKFRLKDILTMKDWQKDCLVDVTCKMLVYTKTDNNAMKQVDAKIIFSSTFIPIFNSSTFKSKYRKEELELLEQADDGFNTGEKLVSMILLNVTAQNALKTVFNQVIDEGNTVGTAIQWMTCELPISGAIIDTPDNGGTQKDIIIPPMSYVQAMNFIQSNYGIYENGLMIFYDIDGILYVLDKYSYEHECVKGASTLTKIYKLESEEDSVGNIIRKCDDNGDPQYTGAMVIKRQSNEVLDGEISGKTIVFSSFQQGLDSIKYDEQEVNRDGSFNVSAALTRNVPTNNISGDKILTEYDELNNIYNMSSYFNELEALAQRMLIKLTNVNVNDFVPNVIIELTFEDVVRNNEQSGQYFLNETIFQFARLPEADAVGLAADKNDLKNYKYSPTITTCNSVLNVSRPNPEN